MGHIGHMHDDDFTTATQAFLALVDRIPDDAWSGAGLGDWDLRALVGHTSRSLVTVESYLGQPAAQVDVPSPAAYVAGLGAFSATDEARAAVTQRGVAAGQAMGDDPAAFLRSLAARVLSLVAAQDDPLITTIAGGMRLSDYLPTRVFELVVHGRDIARAVMLDDEYDARLVEQAVVLAARAAALRGEGGTLLDALTGRGHLPDQFGRL